MSKKKLKKRLEALERRVNKLEVEQVYALPVKPPVTRPAIQQTWPGRSAAWGEHLA